MKGWLLVNAFILGIGLLAASLLFLLASLMNLVGMPPDENRALTALGGIACLFLTYYLSKWIYRRLA